MTSKPIEILGHPVVQSILDETYKIKCHNCFDEIPLKVLTLAA